MKKIIVLILIIISFNSNGQTTINLSNELNQWTSIEVMKCNLIQFDPYAFFAHKRLKPNNLPRIIIKMDSYDCENGFDEYRFYKDLDLAEQHFKRFNQGISFEQTIFHGKAKEYHIPLLKYMFSPNLKRS